MALQAPALILSVVLAAGALAAQAQPRDPDRLKTPRTPWYQLSPDERRILSPVAPDWDRMPGYQQERLKGAARKYPEMQPIPKERFEQRIRDWATMTPDQRRQARETFQGLRKLPPAKQHELRERYLERHRSDGARSRGDGPGRDTPRYDPPPREGRDRR